MSPPISPMDFAAAPEKVRRLFYFRHRKGKPMKTASDLLDLVIDRLNLKNDAALAAELDVSKAAISKMRTGTLPVGPSALVRMHEATGLTIGQLRESMGLPARMYVHAR